MKQLNESLNYLDMQNQVTPTLGIDEFKSNIGEDSDLIVLNFVVSGEAVADDLVSWLERGYDFIVDGERSPGEVLDKKYYVFAEMMRKRSAPKRIIEILDDLKTLTGLEVSDWTLKINGKKIDATVENITDNLILSSVDYKKNAEDDLNEWREIAGIKTKEIFTEYDDEILDWQRKANII